MPDRDIRIRIQSQADNAGFDSTIAKTKEMRSAITGALESLKTGVGIDIGGRIVESLREIPKALEEAVAHGVEFNKEMETAQNTIAGTLKQFSNGDIKTFQEGVKDAAGVMDLLREKASQLGLSYKSMLEGFASTQTALFHAGVNDLQQQVQLVTLINSALSARGISGFQALRDTRDILLGRGERTLGGQELGINDEEVKKAIAGGNALEYFQKTLSGAAETGSHNAETLAGQLNILHNSIDGLTGEATKPFFDELKLGLTELNSTLSAQSTKDMITGIADAVRGLIEVGTSVPAKAAGSAVGGILETLLPGGTEVEAVIRGLQDRGAASRLARPPLSTPAPSLNAPLDFQEEGKPDKSLATIARDNARIDANLNSASELDLTPEQLLAKRQKDLAAKRTDFAKSFNDTGGNIGSDFDIQHMQGALGAGDEDLADKLREVSELTKQVAEAQKKVTDEHEKTNKEMDKEEEDARRFAEEQWLKRERALESLHEEQAIQSALANGDEAKAKNLEIERRTREEINRLVDLGMSRDEATKEAGVTAELQKQKNLRDQMEKQQAALDQLDVDNATTSSARKRAQAKQHHDQVANELQAAGITGSDYQSQLDKSDRAFRRKQGIIGGPASRSPSDNIAGLDNGQPSSDLAGLLRTAPAGQALTPQTPFSEFSGGGNVSGDDSGLGQAGDAQSNAADTMGSAASSLSSAAQKMETVADSISTAADSIGTGLDSLSNSISSIAARVTALEDDAS